MSYEPHDAGQPPMQDHPESTKLLILSIISVVCCLPIAIYTLIKSNSIMNDPASASTNLGKIKAVRIISIIALVWWIAGTIIGFFSGLGESFLGAN